MGGVVSVLAFLPPERERAKLHEHEATVHLRTETGDTVPAVGLWPNDKKTRGSRLIIIYSHGNAEVRQHTRIYFIGFRHPIELAHPRCYHCWCPSNFTHNLRIAKDLTQGWPELQRYADMLGVPVFGFDYPGYGTSTGRPTEVGCFAAARAVWAHVREQEPQAKIVLWGRSLGSGPAVHMAATSRPAEPLDQNSPLAGLVLQSPVASCVGTVLGKAGVRRSAR